MMLDRYPALVLNADFRPVSLFPLELKNAKEAIKNVWEDTVSVVAEYDQIVRSPSVRMKIPSVVALRTFVKPTTHVTFSAPNVFLRDRLRCQYCGERRRTLTIDHVHPVSKGGLDCWANVVAACEPCNWKERRHGRAHAPDEGAPRADAGRAARARSRHAQRTCAQDLA